MSLYEKNMSSLDKRYPELSSKIRNINDTDSESHAWTEIAGAVANVSYLSEDGEILIYANDDPVAYCRGYLRSRNFRFAPFIVFLGFGLGYQVQVALEELSRELRIQYVIIIERDIELFQKALRHNDFSRIIMHPSIHFFVGLSTEDLFFSLRTYFVHRPDVLEYARNLKFIIMPAVHIAEGHYYRAAHQCVKNTMNHIFQHMGNDPYDALLGIRQTIANLRPQIEDPGIIAFRDCCKEKPAIVVGAGPSLNKNIRLLREAGDRAILIAVDAALKPLLENGIRPHIVTNIERTAGVNAFFLNLGPQEDIFFVFSPVTAPETYSAFHGPKIIAHRYEKLMNWLSLPKGALLAGPLVGNFAFDIAQYFGCNPIIMVGQDLSFTSGGATHVHGNVFGHIDEYKKDTLEVAGNYGERLLTTPSFNEGRKSLEVQIRHYPGVCINATEGGARIKGSQLISLKQAIDAYCRISIQPLDIIKRIWSAEREKLTSGQSEISRIDRIIEESLAEMDGAVADCQKGLTLMNTFLNENPLRLESRVDPELLKRIGELTGELNAIRKKIISLPSFVVFEMVIQGYHFDLEMRRNMAYEQFHFREFADLRSFLLFEEWFATVGQLILSTIYALREGTLIYRQGL